MGFVDKIKEFIKKLKADNAGFGATMARINASGYCGNVNRGIKNGDFWEGSYISIENNQGVIYGSNQADYSFVGGDIASFELVPGANCIIHKGKESIPGNRFIITFKDGKRAQADIIPAKLPAFNMTLNL